MAFSKKVCEEALVACGRYCCICHKFCGTKIELHHIHQVADGGDDSFDNCIPLCFDCHSDMERIDPNHPKGRHYSENELRLHRDNWYKKCSSSTQACRLPVIKEADIILFNSICSNVFDDKMCYDLTHTDFTSIIPSHIFETLDSFYHSFINNPFCEFIDFEMEECRGRLFAAIDKLVYTIAENTFVKMIGDDRYSVTHLWLLGQGEIPRNNNIDYDEYVRQTASVFEKEANDLRNAAAELLENYRAFVRQGRLLFDK